MKDILLGTLNNSNSTLYNTNMEHNILNIERANVYNGPEYLKQFDSLKFVNKGIPVSINQATNNTNNNEINFQNGYSDFENKNMDYNIVTKEHFTHNNMTPNTARRDVYTNLENNSLKYQKLSGNNEVWKNKKETTPFFEPFSDLTNVNGMPVVADKLIDRYIPSGKNNYGNLPFQTNIRVLPGIDNVVAPPYPVARILPRNIDDLRSENNQKQTFESKPLVTIKKGELRPTDPVITKYKLPSYIDTPITEYQKTSSQNKGMALRSQPLYVTSQRGDLDTYYNGPSVNNTQGQYVNSDAIYFTDPKKENYLNDFTVGINAVNTRPVFSNINSYNLCETERNSTIPAAPATGPSLSSNGSYFIDRTAIANKTIKEDTIYANKLLGINQNNNIHTSYAFKSDAILPFTMRETNNDQILNTSTCYEPIYLKNKDIAKQTLKETYIDKPVVSNISSSYQNLYKEYLDEAKQTLKELNIDKPVSSNISSLTQNIYNKNNDIAKTTVKETTENSLNQTNLTSDYKSIYNKNNDIAKPTVKESTINNTYTSNIQPSQQNIHNAYTDNAKTTVKESTINNTYTSNIHPSQQNIHSAYTDTAKSTVKESTIDNKYTSNIQPSQQNIHNAYTDNAKTTVKESTINNTYTSNIQPSQQNIHNAYTDNAKTTVKESTIDNKYTSNIQPSQQNMHISYTDTAKTTVKESTIDNNYTSNIQPSQQNMHISYTDTAKTTVKESTIDNNYTPNIQPSQQNMHISYTDTAKMTVKESTIDNNYISNIQPPQQTAHVLYTDTAKSTLKESTIDKLNNTQISTGITESYIKTHEIAKPTIKETTLHAYKGNVVDTTQGNYIVDNNNIARPTIKQTTIIKNYISNSSNEIKGPKSDQAEKNMCIDDKRQITATFNRPGNAKSDTIRGDIVKENVRMNDRKTLYGYVSIPNKPLNYTVTPMNKIYTDKKTSLNDNNFYRIDPLFIDTLKNNPLVNDIYHQKNIDFNSAINI